MAKESAIEWTEATWNPWHGCHKVSQGCKNCYMFRDKARYGQDANVVVRSKTKFYDPLKWTDPRTIFTCSWSDFFIEESDPWRDEAFAIMALTPHHTYQVLTKRPDRMLEYFADKQKHWIDLGISEAVRKIDVLKYSNLCRKGELLPHLQEDWFWDQGDLIYEGKTPLPNVWLGVSVEDQKTADERIPILLQTPAAVRWLSIEPLLGPVDLDRWFNYTPDCKCRGGQDHDCSAQGRINWTVCGGESGHDARPMHPDWARSIRDQCQSAGVPFFFKQWGEYAPWGINCCDFELDLNCDQMERKFKYKMQDPYVMYRVGKKKAGRLLDGREWNEMPEVSNGR